MYDFSALFQQQSPFAQEYGQQVGPRSPYYRGGPSTPANMPMPANIGQISRGMFNTQATGYGYGNAPLQSPWGSYLPRSPMMQQYLPQYQQTTMRQQQQANPFQWGSVNPFNNRNSPYPYNNQGVYRQQAAPQQSPQAAPQQPAPQQAVPQNVVSARQAWHQSITPEQAALRGGVDGNKDFRAALTPEQIRLQQAAQATRGGQAAPQAAQQFGAQQLQQLLQQLLGGYNPNINLGMGY